MKKFIIGFILGSVLFGSISVFAASIDTTIQITRNVEKLVINGNNYALQDKIFTNNGTTYVPLRFLSETFNHIVEWDKEAKTIQIHLDPCKLAAGIAMNPLPEKSGPVSVRNQRALCINDRALLLPKDVYIDGIVVNDHGAESLGQLPAYRLSRGDSTILVGFKGLLLSNDRDTLDNHFEFLKQYVYESR